MKEIRIVFNHDRTYYEMNLDHAREMFNLYGGNALEKAYCKAFSQLELYKFYSVHPTIKMFELDTYLDFVQMFEGYFDDIKVCDGGMVIEIEY